MTQEDKDLLLRDLSARLPYGVKIRIGNDDAKAPIIQELEVIGINIDKEFAANGWSFERIGIKPYLRPMSSMTDEEEKEYLEIKCEVTLIDGLMVMSTVKAVDWLNAHYFDYRNLIEKGLAIAVTDDNNPYGKDNNLKTI